MSEKVSAESLELNTDDDDDDENRLDRLSLQESLSRIEFRDKNEIISPEDIAAVAFSRIFDENSHFSPNLSTIHEISIRKRALFNEDSESTSGRIYPKTSITRSPTSHQGNIESPKYRHKSPSNRSHLYHPPLLSKDAIQNWNRASGSIRKTKSTALPAIINTPWPRTTTASTPELKVDDQSIVLEPLPPNTEGENDRRAYLVRTMCYYNLRLIYIILNCFTLVIGFVYLGAAITFCVYKEIVLIIVGYQVHVSSVVFLFGLGLFLLTIGTIGLCLVRDGTKKSAAHAGFSLVMGAVLIALAFLQSAAQLSIEVAAEFQMLSSIQLDFTRSNPWDSLHQIFKCCGVRGYMDWCQKLEVNQKIYNSAKDFLGSFTCNLPESCCLDHKPGFLVFRDIDYTSCIFAPTPSNTYRSGCLTPILLVVSYLGKMFRIANFVTAFLLLLTATASMILFTYL